MTPTTGDIWSVDVGAETRRSVYVISNDRFHQLAERAIVAPLIPAGAAERNPPWWIAHDDSVVAVERSSSIPLERLLERQGTARYTTVQAVERTIERLTRAES